MSSSRPDGYGDRTCRVCGGEFFACNETDSDHADWQCHDCEAWSRTEQSFIAESAELKKEEP